MKELKFIVLGTGDYKSPHGSSSYFTIIDDNLILIDCGDTTFRTLLTYNEKNEINKLTPNVFITHLHADHIGSLPSLIMYYFYELKKKTNIHVGSIATKLSLMKILKEMGVDNNCYEIKYGYNLLSSKNIFKFDNILISFIGTKHVSQIESYGILFTHINETNNKKNNFFYISGDSTEIPTFIKKEIKNSTFDLLLQDVSMKENGVHLSFDKLKKEMAGYEDKILCTHYNINDVDKDNNRNFIGYHKIDNNVIDGFTFLNNDTYFTFDFKWNE